MNIISDKFTDCWVLCKSRSNPGKQYYFNTRTRESSWIKPKAVQEKESCSNAAIKVDLSRNEDRNRKEEERKCLRRNYGNNTTESSRKSKNEVQQKQKPKQPHSSISHGSRHNHLNMNKNKTKCSQSLKPAKNLAKNRLTKLRNQLALELEQEKKGKRSEPKVENLNQTTKTETPMKNQRSELNSPNYNESNCTITSQLSNDSSSSSPSQFFAANKIITSMKAQLPEEYDNKVVQKDTFADIEQGICSKITGYPSNVHPSTPPQFSEADKLLSAIKSKLAYKMPVKDNSDSSGISDRMQMLRRLSNDVDDSRSSRHIEQMDVDEGVTLVYSRVDPHKPSSSSCAAPSMLNTIQTTAVIVVDTNIFIHDLHCITHVLNSQIKGYREQPTLLVPWRVINELDKLKDNNNGNGVLCKRAKAAMDYLYKSLPVGNRLKGQSLRDSNSHIFPCEVPDDEILNCCLQQSERGKSVVLLSNDKNLCNKAVINGIRTMSVAELKALLEGRRAPPDPSLSASVSHYDLTIYQLLANILETEMRARYKTLWEHVVCRPPPWDLQDVLFALLKHWLAVFHEVFPRIQPLLTDLKKSYTYIKNKDPKTLVEAEVCNFKELCIEVAKKCQIIPEYMELAKNTVDRLNNARQTRGQNNLSVMQAFETVWIIFSSYCGKLCRCLGIPHSIEDQLPGNEPVEGLISKYSLFRNHIISLNHTIQGVLNVDNSSNMLEGRICNLENELKSSLNLKATESGLIARDELRIFCVKNRDLLQDATANLTTLIQLLDICKNNFH